MREANMIEEALLEDDRLAMPDMAETLLRRAMAEYPKDPTRNDFLIHFACTQALDPLPLYRVLCKFYNRQRRFDMALEFAHRALREAARQGGLPTSPESWTRKRLAEANPDVASHALLALKALAFLELRQGNDYQADRHLAILRQLDPEDGSGVSVVSALARAMAEVD